MVNMSSSRYIENKLNLPANLSLNEITTRNVSLTRSFKRDFFISSVFYLAFDL